MTQPTSDPVDPAVRRTCLYPMHDALGARMIDFAGWLMPLSYRSEIAEHNAVRRAAGLFDLGHMGEIELIGPQAARALDYALVGDISALAESKAKYTMICQPDGGIIDDLIVYRLAEQRYLVVANASNSTVVLEELQRRATGFDTQVRDCCDDWALIAVQGPAAATIVAGLTDIPLEDLRYYTVRTGRLAQRPILLARTGYTGEDGFEIFCSPDDGNQIWRVLTEAGEPLGLVPAGLACRDTLRLEAGMPLYGHELSAELTPFAAGLGRVVSLTKDADFVGKSALTAQAEQAPTRRLVGLIPTGRRVPRAGHPVLEPHRNSVIGAVTSGAPSPTLGHPIAMAYLDTAYATDGGQVLIDIRGRAEPAEVVDLPFYRRTR